MFGFQTDVATSCFLTGPCDPDYESPIFNGAVGVALLRRPRLHFSAELALDVFTVDGQLTPALSLRFPAEVRFDGWFAGAAVKGGGFYFDPNGSRDQSDLRFGADMFLGFEAEHFDVILRPEIGSFGGIIGAVYAAATVGLRRD
ncbi:MAG: hypothetical protein AAF654_06820 [Myxococcota bacterium]